MSVHPSPDTILPAVVGLVAFVGLFGGAVALLRWLQKRTGSTLGGVFGSDQVRVITRQPLAWQCLLVVVEVGGNQYIITASRSGAVTVIDKLDEPLPERTSAESGFARKLRQAINRKEGRR